MGWGGAVRGGAVRGGADWPKALVGSILRGRRDGGGRGRIQGGCDRLTDRRILPRGCFSVLASSFDLENGLPSDKGPLDAQSRPSVGRTLQSPVHHGQRRESFLYRSDSDHEPSPKAVSRTSSAASDL